MFQIILKLKWKIW